MFGCCVLPGSPLLFATGMPGLLNYTILPLKHYSLVLNSTWRVVGVIFVCAFADNLVIIFSIYEVIVILQKHYVIKSVFNADAAVSLQCFCSEDTEKFVLTCLQLDVFSLVHVHYIPGEAIHSSQLYVGMQHALKNTLRRGELSQRANIHYFNTNIYSSLILNPFFIASDNTMTAR